MIQCCSFKLCKLLLQKPKRISKRARKHVQVTEIKKLPNGLNKVKKIHKRKRNSKKDKRFYQQKGHDQNIYISKWTYTTKKYSKELHKMAVITTKIKRKKKKSPNRFY